MTVLSKSRNEVDDMKTIFKSILTFVLISALMIVSTFPVLAVGNVTYDGNAKKFIFEPGSNSSPSDLFTDFKGVMPGDSITQQVVVKNDVSNNVKIKLYIRSLGAKDGSEDLLSKLKLSVRQKGKTELFEAPADQTAQLTDWVYLGTFYSGAEINLDVTLDVPIELDNEYRNSIGSLDWQFKVEELPVDPDDLLPPITGFDLDTVTYVVTGVISLAVLSLVIVLAVRKKKLN